MHGHMHMSIKKVQEAEEQAKQGKSPPEILRSLQAKSATQHGQDSMAPPKQQCPRQLRRRQDSICLCFVATSDL